MKKSLYLLMLCFILPVSAAEQFVSFTGGDVCLTDRYGEISYDENDWKGVQIAINNLKEDLRQVTGRCDYPITIGTYDHSNLINSRELKHELKGKWEKYVITVSEDGITIAGSDKRGTIYGIYELSKQIGVSPWYWMADVPIAKHNNVYVKCGQYTDGEPKVKYRGIFINDEWPSFGSWCVNQFGGINSKAYSRIFEMLLRLKANYFWPAMWDSRFNEDDPLSPQLADEMGIVMGTSHHEPMMRAHKEYTSRRGEVGPWDYSVNAERLDKFFLDGMERNKEYENIVTIGMRGDGDVAMGKGNDVDNMKTLSKVIDGQRRILSDVYKKPAKEIPQLWAIFTEVQRYYDAGFNVPDDVTLLFCDNNWGYIRRIGRDFERKRKGGLGLYYHIDMNGGPWNDRWVNTTTIPKLREQLGLAYKTGLDRIWIINVGDLKPKEVPIDFIMTYAWNPDAIQPGDEKAYLEGFARSIFGDENAAEVADIIAKYSKYNLWRKPEAQYPGIFNMEEMMVTNNKWQSLVLRCETLKETIAPEAQDAFYQLVYYPAVASAGVAMIYNATTMGDTLLIEQLMEKDRRLSDYYNNQLAGGKWRGMMSDYHIGYTRWSMADKDYNPMTLGFKVAHNLYPNKDSKQYSIPAYQYTKNISAASNEWILYPDLGRAAGCMGAKNVDFLQSKENDHATLEYEVYMTSCQIAIGILPTQDIHPARGLRLGVQIDNQPLQVIDARRGLVDIFNEYTPQNLALSKVLKQLPRRSRLALSGFVDGRQLPRRDEVFDNIRWLDASFDVAPGKHVLKIVMIDPEIVVEQIVVNPDNDNYSYFGY